MSKLKTIKNEIREDLEKVNDLIELTLDSTNEPQLKKIYKHLIKQKGKQIRASLSLTISKTNNFTIDTSTIQLSAGIELLHLASLVHDDIIDKSYERRNQETVYKKYGLNNGILCGVHLYSLALNLILKIENHSILSIISKTVTNLCEGESLQVNNRNNYLMNINEYLNMVKLKTSSLFSATCKAPLILNNASNKDIKAWGLFGELLGDIFQITDDYLDIFDKKNKLKKQTNQDFFTGDISLPILIATEKSNLNNMSQIRNYISINQNDISKSTKKIIDNKFNEALNTIGSLKLNKNNKNKIINILDLVAKRI